MSAAPTSPLLRYIRRLVARGQHGVGDRELLQSYLEHRDETAFAALVERHGPMVLGVCTAVLRHRQDAEDAFQATFLVLARKAISIRKRDGLASWLHGVAYRVAQKARAAGLRRQEIEAKVAPPAPLMPADDLPWGEVRAILHEELAALPEHLRQPLVMCHLQGLTQEETARRLGWTATTVKGRLGRGRELLGQRLERRGIGLAAIVGATALTGKALAGPVPAKLVDMTVRAVLGGAIATGGTAAAILAKGVLAPLVPVKWTVLAGILLMGVAVAGGLARVGHHGQDDGQAGQIKTKAVAQKPVQKTDAYGDPLPEGAIARLGSSRFRQGGAVKLIAFSPDGKSLLSVDDNNLHVWDGATGKHLRRLGVQNVECISADCRVVATLVGQRQKIDVWDVIAGRLLQSIGSKGTIACVGLSPDGKTLSLVELGRLGKQSVLELWDTTTGERRQQIFGAVDHSDDRIVGMDGKTSFNSVLCSDGKTVITSDERSVRAWDVATGKHLHQIVFPDGECAWRTAIAPDGKTVAVHYCGFEKSALWDLATGKEIHRLEHSPHPYVFPFAFTPDGKMVFSNEKSGPIWWDVATGKQLHQDKMAKVEIGALAFSPDGKLLATAARDKNVIHLWETETGKEKAVVGGRSPPQALWRPPTMAEPLRLRTTTIPLSAYGIR